MKRQNNDKSLQSQKRGQLTFENKLDRFTKRIKGTY